ncbi:MAG TPA: hypothetical protein ACFYD1_05950 [Candidatus Hypogeohydataceae bacterium YC38]|jgi:hypothetical protein|nr:hypothetical protein [Candidatus Brocadiales bacterium]
MDLEKFSSSADQPSLDVSQVINQVASYVSLKEFHKKGLKELKVLSVKDIVELIDKSVEGEVQKRFQSLTVERDALERHCKELEAHIAGLRGELERYKEAPKEAIPEAYLTKEKWEVRLKEAVSETLQGLKEILGEKELPEEFSKRLEEDLLKALLERTLPVGQPFLTAGYNKELYGPSSDSPPVERQEKKKGGLLEDLLRQNILLREKARPSDRNESGKES